MLYRFLCLALAGFALLPASARADAPHTELAPFDPRDAGKPDARLEGTWSLVSLDGVTPTPKKRWPGVFDINFSGGTVSGREACNRFFGPYRVVGDHLETALVETTAGCRSPQADPWDFAALKAVESGDFKFDARRRSLVFRDKTGRNCLFVRKQRSEVQSLW